jgi:N-carbamoyl-L-amino-acid hydrolase/ureidoglycolate amidohydrolase
VDLRSSDFEAKQDIIAKLRHCIDSVAFIRCVKVSTETVAHEHPAKTDRRIVETIQAVCDKRHTGYNRMVSGAYHDAMFVAQFAPFGMIFVPSKGGISHHEDEWTDYEDIATGVDILAETLLHLSNEQ